MRVKIKFKKPVLVKLLIIILLVAGGAAGGWFYRGRSISSLPREKEKAKSKYLAFTMEVYDKIKDNYWEKTTDEGLAKIYLLAIEKIIGRPQHLKESNRQNLEKKIEEVLSLLESEEKKKEFTVKLADIVLANLKPFGRSRLYLKKDEIALRNNVNNKTNVDHYQVLGIEKNATQKEIEKAYQEKAEKLAKEKDQSKEAEQEYQAVAQAHKVLSDQEARRLYDTAGIEPTIDYQIIGSRILHLHLTKFSPTTMEDLQRVTEKADHDPLDTLIFDLRDNIGGAIDGLPYFLGPFIGNDQYAYQFLHQGEREDFKTKVGWMNSLVRYKKVVILINEGTQSSAEVMASVLKKYNVGVLVGRTTKGWGTVEKVFKLENQIDDHEEYSIFLAHSLTLREDGQPIEGKGVDPLISIDNPNWEKELNQYFNDQEIVDAVKEVLKD